MKYQIRTTISDHSFEVITEKSIHIHKDVTLLWMVATEAITILSFAHQVETIEEPSLIWIGPK